jgi:hypothetical protein
LSPAPRLSIPIGVIVERCKAASQWVDFVWRPITVLPGQPEAEPWTVLAREGGSTTFYAGTIALDLYPRDTGSYRDNLASGAPSVWIALRLTGSEPPYRLFAATVDPSEGESFTEAGNDLVESVPMPDIIRETLAAFIVEHHIEEQFVKRKRDRADPEALARRMPGREDDHK